METTTYFDAEILKELREYTRTFLKLDLAYLVAGGAIVTALKISRGELIEFGASLRFVAAALLILGLIDVSIDSLVFNDWLSARTGIGRRTSGKLLARLFDVQPWFHFVFIAGLTAYAFGFASGAHDARTRIEGRVLFQEQVEQYVQKNGLAPKSLKEMDTVSPIAKVILSKLDGEGVRVESTGPKTYKITFAGDDKTFETADDVTATQDFILRKAFDSLFNEPVKDGAKD